MSGIEKTEQFAKIFPAAERRSVDFKLFRNHRIHIVVRFAARGCAAGNQSAAVREGVQALLPYFTGDAVENDVYSAIVS
ncbi:hypothetical protein D3C83_189170 [compost metagenome]